MRYAVMDLGSNTFLCLIVEVNSNGDWIVLEDRAEVVRLGQGLSQAQMFAPNAIERARSCLFRFANLIESYRVDASLAVATAAARSAKNVSELTRILDEISIPLKIISGEEEADLTFRGALGSVGLEGQYVVIDIGGGSTEVIVSRNREISFRRSFDIGVVKLKDQYFDQDPPTAESLNLIHRRIESEMEDLLPLDESEQNIVVAVAGTPTTLASAVLGGFERDKIDGFIFTKSDLESWINRLGILTSTQIVQQLKVEPGRADVLLIGVILLRTILEKLKVEQLKVSVRGLRYGVVEVLNSRGSM